MIRDPSRPSFFPMTIPGIAMRISVAPVPNQNTPPRPERKTSRPRKRPQTQPTRRPADAGEALKSGRNAAIVMGTLLIMGIALIILFLYTITTGAAPATP